VAERDYAVARLLDDDDNYVSNLVDVGTCEPLGRATGGIGAFTDEELRCRNFFRPRPSLRIKASGEVSLCPLVEAGDGYGNVHTRDVVDILNHLHEAFVYRLHAEKRVGEVRPFLDPGLFGSEPRHACGVRTALNMLGRAMRRRRRPGRPRGDPGDQRRGRREDGDTPEGDPESRDRPASPTVRRRGEETRARERDALDFGSLRAEAFFRMKRQIWRS
jgi:hypothetical protein